MELRFDVVVAENHNQQIAYLRTNRLCKIFVSSFGMEEGEQREGSTAVQVGFSAAIILQHNTVINKTLANTAKASV